MPNSLVIVESPGKIKKLKQILGNDYHILASMGHVLDLPPKSFGVTLSTMQPDYTVVKADVAKRLRAEADKPYQTVYLASDPDREGEAIAAHVGELLKRAGCRAPLRRVTFDALTPSVVKAAFEQPREINQPLVDAQAARRILDRLVGFPASRLLWSALDGKGLSAGRVQSVALRLVVEREREISAFVPTEFWRIMGRFSVAAGNFDARLHLWDGVKPSLHTQSDAQAVIDALAGAPFQITQVTPKQRQQKPPAPFTTSTLQQAASSHLKLAPEATMKLAQQLYEAALITYHRTDSPAVSPEGVAMAHATIRGAYGDAYLGQHSYGAKGNAQEAHECLRPTDTDLSPDAARLQLGAGNERAADLYGIIHRRFLASQMANAVFNELHVHVTGGRAVFAAKGSQQLFDGFLRVYRLREERDSAPAVDADDESPDVTLPALTVGETATCQRLTPSQHFTQPPPRFSEALLVKALETHGVGRPSTYAQTLATLKKRGYVTLNKRQLTPSALGTQVTDVLTARLPSLFAVDFTAAMETALDEIAAGRQPAREYLLAFWGQVAPLFGESVVTAATQAPAKAKARRQNAPKPAQPAPPVNPALGACPQCGKALVARRGKFGAFIGCSAYPKCRFTRPT